MWGIFRKWRDYSLGGWEGTQMKLGLGPKGLKWYPERRSDLAAISPLLFQCQALFLGRVSHGMKDPSSGRKCKKSLQLEPLRGDGDKKWQDIRLCRKTGRGCLTLKTFWYDSRNKWKLLEHLRHQNYMVCFKFLEREPSITHLPLRTPNKNLFQFGHWLLPHHWDTMTDRSHSTDLWQIWGLEVKKPSGAWVDPRRIKEMIYTSHQKDPQGTSSPWEWGLGNAGGWLGKGCA